jgi:hypothetical protein
MSDDTQQQLVEPTPEEVKAQARLDKIDKMERDVAQFLTFMRQNPEFADFVYGFDFGYHCSTGDDFWRACRILKGRKDSSDDFLLMQRLFGDITIRVQASKSTTCRRVQVGVDFKEVEVYPDDVSPTLQTVEAPVYDWECPESWLRRVEGRDEPNF